MVFFINAYNALAIVSVEMWQLPQPASIFCVVFGVHSNDWLSSRIGQPCISGRQGKDMPS